MPQTYSARCKGIKIRHEEDSNSSHSPKTNLFKVKYKAMHEIIGTKVGSSPQIDKGATMEVKDKEYYINKADNVLKHLNIQAHSNLAYQHIQGQIDPYKERIKRNQV